jgi:hypothetical protein
MGAKLPPTILSKYTKRNKFMLKTLLLRTETYARHVPLYGIPYSGT